MSRKQQMCCKHERNNFSNIHSRLTLILTYAAICNVQTSRKMLFASLGSEFTPCHCRKPYNNLSIIQRLPVTFDISKHTICLLTRRQFNVKFVLQTLVIILSCPRIKAIVQPACIVWLKRIVTGSRSPNSTKLFGRWGKKLREWENQRSENHSYRLNCIHRNTISERLKRS